MSNLFDGLINKTSLLAHTDGGMREIITGAFGVLVLRSCGAILAFGFNVFLGRLLGAGGTGVYYMALTVTTVAVVIGRAGMDNALLRFTAASAAQENWIEVAGAARQGLLIAAGLSALATATIFFFAPWFSHSIFGEPSLTLPLQVMSLSIIPQSLLILYGELLRAINRTRDSVVVQAIGVPLISTILLLAFAKIGGAVGAAAAYALASIFVLLYSIVQWRRMTPQIRNQIGQFSLIRLVSTSLPLFWVSLMSLVTASAATIFLGIWGTAQEVGIFNVASRTALLTSFVLLAVNTIVAPRFAVLFERKDLPALGRLARDTARLMTIVAAPPTLLFIAAPRFVLQVFGGDFVEGAAVLSILAIGQFVNVATGSVGYLLLMTGHERMVRNKSAFIMVTGLIVLAVLIRFYGLTGAAIGSALILSLDNLISVWLAYRNLSILTIPGLARLLPSPASGSEVS